MRKFYHSIWTFLLCSGAILAQSGNGISPLVLTGFNADVVAEGTGSNTSDKTTHTVDAFYTFYSEDYVPLNPHSSGASASIYGGGLPVNGIINSPAVDGLSFQMADYTQNNALVLRNNVTNTGTLTLTTPKAAAKIYVAAVRGEGGSGTSDNHNVTATVNFADETSEEIVFQATAWWFDNNPPANIALSGTGQVSRNTATSGWAPQNEFRGLIQSNLYYNELELSAANQNKNIISIEFEKAATSNDNHTTAILGVSILESTPLVNGNGISGYNYDIIANGIGNATASSQIGLDEQNQRALVSLDFQATESSAFPTYGLPANGMISSANTPGIIYQLADYSGPNALYLTPSHVTGSANTTNSGTLSFTAANKEKVYILSTAAGGGASSLPYTATIHFSDETTQVANLQAKDWYGNSNFAIQGIGRIHRTNNNLEGNTTDPRLYEDVITLTTENQTKEITGITFAFEGNASADWANEIRFAVLAVTTAEAPEPAMGCTGTIEPGTTPGDTGCVTFIYQGQTVSYTTVRAEDGNVWLQQNLGSTQVATSAADELSYGHYFQWGRWDDGHQVPNSTITATPPAPNNPSGLNGGSTSFYSVAYNNPDNWWYGGTATDTWNAATVSEVTATNGCDPCKALGEGWRLPSIQEVSSLITSENLSDTNAGFAFLSNLKIPSAGIKDYSGLSSQGTRAYLWASSPAEVFYSGLAVTVAGSVSRDTGVPVRCIYQAPVIAIEAVNVITANSVPASILVTGGTLQLNATVNPENANQEVVWSVTSGTDYASVNQNGLVSGVSNGTAVIRATSVEDETKFDEITVTIDMVTPAYCIPTYSGWAVDEPAEPITLVQFGVVENLSDAINQTSSSEVSTSTPRYEDFSAVSSVTVTRGESYTLKVKGNTNGNNTNYITIYFDWNGDGTFSNATPADAAAQQQLTNQPEKHQHTTAIINSTGLDEIEMVHTVTIPTDAIVGQTRMRIVKNMNVPSNAPCANPFFPRGQVEDYTLNITESSAVNEVEVTTQNNVPAIITATGGTLQLEAAVLPVATAPQEVIWSITEGNSAVSVSTTGLVTALVNNGSAIIRATSVENNTKFDEIEVTVAVPQTPATLDFEDNFETNTDWTFVNQEGRSTKWVIGSAVSNGTGKSLYVSDDNGATHSADLSIVQTVHTYRDIIIPEGTTGVDVSFDWMSVGQFAVTGWGYSVYNFMEVWIVPDSFTPVGGTLITGETNHIKLQGNHEGGNFLEQESFTTFTHNNLDLSAYAGETVRLVFSWKNINGTTGLPGAIDNVSVSATNPDSISVIVSTENNVSTTLTQAGQELQLVATITPDTASDEVTWTVNTGVDFVSISETGLVTAVANGVATVRATSVEDPTKFGEIEITVAIETEPVICEAVNTIDENFNAFTAFPENCWTSSHAAPYVSLEEGDAADNKIVQLYSFFAAEEPIYIISPQLIQIENNKALSFDIVSISQPGATLEIGTLTDPTDLNTFAAIQDAFVPEAGTITSDEIPVSETAKYIAVKFNPNGMHKSLQIDNIRLVDALSSDSFDVSKVLIYPNPSKGIFNIQSDLTISNVEVYNALGQRVWTGSSNTIDIQGQASGVYFIKVHTEDNFSHTYKVIKE